MSNDMDTSKIIKQLKSKCRNILTEEYGIHRLPHTSPIDPRLDDVRTVDSYNANKATVQFAKQAEKNNIQPNEIYNKVLEYTKQRDPILKQLYTCVDQVCVNDANAKLNALNLKYGLAPENSNESKHISGDDLNYILTPHGLTMSYIQMRQHDNLLKRLAAEKGESLKFSDDIELNDELDAHNIIKGLPSGNTSSLYKSSIDHSEGEYKNGVRY